MAELESFMGHGGREYSKLDFAWEKLDNIIDLQERWMVITHKFQK
jgi:hypothetical protein